MAYGRDLFQQKRPTPYMGPTTTPAVSTTLPTPTPPPKTTPGVAPGITGGATVKGGYVPLGARDLSNVPQGPILKTTSAGGPPANTMLAEPGYTIQPGNSVNPGSMIPVSGVSQARVNMLGSLGVQTSLNRMQANNARTAYNTAYRRAISNR